MSDLHKLKKKKPNHDVLTNKLYKISTKANRQYFAMKVNRKESS